MSKKLFVIIIALLLMSMLTSCDKFPMPTEREPSTLTTRETLIVDAVVESYDEHHWYAGYAHHYKYRVDVYCQEYNLRKTFNDQVSGMWITSDLAGLKKGQVIKVEVIKETTGTNVRMYINKIIK